MGRPTVREQRNKWVVRIDGVDTETGKVRPRQLATYTSKRAATTAASQFASDGDTGGDRRTVGHVVEKWAATRVHVAGNTRQQDEWAAGHIKDVARVDARSESTGNHRSDPTNNWSTPAHKRSNEPPRPHLRPILARRHCARLPRRLRTPAVDRGPDRPPIRRSRTGPQPDQRRRNRIRTHLPDYARRPDRTVTCATSARRSLVTLSGLAPLTERSSGSVHWCRQTRRTRARAVASRRRQSPPPGVSLKAVRRFASRRGDEQPGIVVAHPTVRSDRPIPDPTQQQLTNAPSPATERPRLQSAQGDATRIRRRTHKTERATTTSEGSIVTRLIEASAAAVGGTPARC